LWYPRDEQQVRQVPFYETVSLIEANSGTLFLGRFPLPDFSEIRSQLAIDRSLLEADPNLGHHDNDSTILFPDHLPKVGRGVCERALRRDERSKAKEHFDQAGKE
jgi:hypothetical protein